MDGQAEQSQTQTSGQLHQSTLQVGGVEREFSYYVPGGTAESKLPIVVYLHGHGDKMRHILGKARHRSASSEWMKVAEREGFLVFYPLGLKGPGLRGKTGWNDCRLNAKGNPDGDDIGFIKQLLEFAVRDHNGDRKRFYVTGMSNGGHMTMRVAMEMSETVAAVALIAALLPKDSLCTPPVVPVPILMMHGSDDPLAPYEGGAMRGGRGVVLSAHETAQTWVKWNRLHDTTEELLSLPDVDQTDDSIIIARTREVAPNGNAVIAYEMQGAGHTEPSRKASMGSLLKRIQGTRNRDIEMADAVWDFFKTRSR